MFINLKWHENGNLAKINYYHDDDCMIKGYKFGPACIIFSENGTITWKQWILDGKLHRDEGAGPQFVSYSDDGTKIKEQYHTNGVCTRKDGPSKICWSLSGEITNEVYHVDGIPISKQEFNKLYGNTTKCKTCKASFIQKKK